MSMVHSGQGAVIPTALVERLEVAGLTRWSDAYLSHVVRGLSKAQRLYVKDGCIHGDCAMVTVRALKRKGLFALEITSPNGQCGFMRLTALGVAVQHRLKATTANSVGTEAEGRSAPTIPPANGEG